MKLGVLVGIPLLSLLVNGCNKSGGLTSSTSSHGTKNGSKVVSEDLPALMTKYYKFLGWDGGPSARWVNLYRSARKYAGQMSPSTHVAGKTFVDVIGYAYMRISTGLDRLDPNGAEHNRRTFFPGPWFSLLGACQLLHLARDPNIGDEDRQRLLDAAVYASEYVVTSSKENGDYLLGGVFRRLTERCEIRWSSDGGNCVEDAHVMMVGRFFLNAIYRQILVLPEDRALLTSLTISFDSLSALGPDEKTPLPVYISVYERYFQAMKTILSSIPRGMTLDDFLEKFLLEPLRIPRRSYTSAVEP